MSGFVITGGDERYPEMKVEVFNPQSGRSCPLPDLPRGMSGHTHCHLVCLYRSCLQVSSRGSFSPASVRLLHTRYGHLCWSLPGGAGEVMLLGGEYSPTTTEIVSADGSSTRPSWDLQYQTRSACGVEVGDTFIVTGGWDTDNRDKALSLRYNSQGVSELLPSLTVSRLGHACASYLNSDGQRVS